MKIYTRLLVEVLLVVMENVCMVLKYTWYRYPLATETISAQDKIRPEIGDRL